MKNMFFLNRDQKGVPKGHMILKINLIFLYMFLFNFISLSNLVYFITSKLKYIRPEGGYYANITKK